MTTLIEKLQAAEEGSPELSAEVYRFFNPDYENYVYAYCPFGGHGLVYPKKYSKHQDFVRFDHHTQSIDAALTLVPEGWVWSKSSDDYVMIAKKLGSRIIAGCHHKSLPIAICIAVLSANKQREETT